MVAVAQGDVPLGKARIKVFAIQIKLNGMYQYQSLDVISRLSVITDVFSGIICFMRHTLMHKVVFE